MYSLGANGRAAAPVNNPQQPNFHPCRLMFDGGRGFLAEPMECGKFKRDFVVASCSVQWDFEGNISIGASFKLNKAMQVVAGEMQDLVMKRRTPICCIHPRILLPRFRLAIFATGR